MESFKINYWSSIVKKVYKHGLTCLVFFISIGFSHSIAQESSKVSSSRQLSKQDSLALQSFKDSVDKLFGRRSHPQLTLSYLSNNVYLGRKDSAANPYLTATLGYLHKSGLFVDLSASYLPVTENMRIDLISLDAGYTFRAGNFSGEFTASKFWYSASSTNVKSDLKGSISFLGAYNIGPIKPSLSPTLNIGTKLDFAFSMGLEHTFYLFKDAMDLTPTFNANASTQNYYEYYYSVRKFKNKKTTVRGSISQQLEGSSQLKMLDYEFSVPINFTIKKLTLNFSPFYAIPTHPAVVVTATKKGNQPPTYVRATEKLGNSFYFQAGLSYKF